MIRQVIYHWCDWLHMALILTFCIVRRLPQNLLVITVQNLLLYLVILVPQKETAPQTHILHIHRVLSWALPPPQEDDKSCNKHVNPAFLKGSHHVKPENLEQLSSI